MLMMLALISPQTRRMFMMLVSCGGWGGGVGGGGWGLFPLFKVTAVGHYTVHDMMLKRRGVGGGVGGGWGGNVSRRTGWAHKSSRSKSSK